MLYDEDGKYITFGNTIFLPGHTYYMNSETRYDKDDNYHNSYTVKDSAGKVITASNYTVTYTNNTNVGTATAKITFKGNYSGTVTRTFAIKKFAAPAAPKVTVKSAMGTGQTAYYMVTPSGSRSIAKNITGLTKGKKYYVSVRSYKTVRKKHPNSV